MRTKSEDKKDDPQNHSICTKQQHLACAGIERFAFAVMIAFGKFRTMIAFGEL